MDARLLSSYRWFRGRTGCVGRDAETALALARAELAARDAGCSWEWTDDYDGWVDLQSYRRHGDCLICHPGKGGCVAGCAECVDRCEACILRDASGEALASRWAIWDADDDYRRMVQAELAYEAQDALLAYSI